MKYINYFSGMHCISSKVLICVNLLNVYFFGNTNDMYNYDKVFTFNSMH